MQSTPIPSRKQSAVDGAMDGGPHCAPAPPHIDQARTFPNSNTISHAQQEVPPVSPKPTYEELRALVQRYDAAPPQRRPFAKFGLVAVIFIIGSALGIGLSSFLGEGRGQASQNSFLSRHPLSLGSNGISNSELPYDGRADKVVPKLPPGNAGVSSGELPYDGGQHAKAEMEGPLTSGSVPPVPPDAALQLSKAAEKLHSAPESKESGSTKDVVSAGKTNTLKRQRPLAHVQQDREIDRIRRQAAEELKKKRAFSPTADSTRKSGQEGSLEKKSRKAGGGHRARVPVMAAMLEQCEQAGNFILREQCKWQLCGGKWGKNGCPSFPQRTTSLN